MQIVKNGLQAGRSQIVLLAAFTVACSAPAAYAQAPAAVFGSSVGINNSAPISSTFGGSGYNGTTGHMAANARGDMFYLDNPYNGANFLAELPYNGSATVQILSGIGSNAVGVTADAAGNLYVSDGNNNGQIDYVPFVNGTYATNTNAANLTACSIPLSGVTAPCFLPLNTAGAGYYFQPRDIQVDAAGDIFMYYGNQYGQASKIYKAPAPAAGGSYVLQLVAAPAASATISGSIAADAAGNLYFVDGNAVTYYTAAALTTAYATSGATPATGTSVGTGLKTPQGVSIDSGNNLYIADTGNTRLVVIPSISGTRNAANQYTLVSGVTINNAPAIDGYGDVYYLTNNSLFETSLGSVHVQGGNQYYFPTTPVTVTFPSGGKLNTTPFTFTGSSAAAFSQDTSSSTTCSTTTTYPAGGSCTLSIKYTQQGSGIELGAVNAISTSGAVLGSALLYALPTGPGLNIDPGTVTAVGSNWAAPSAVTVGNLGSVFVADSSTGKIYNSVNGGAQTTVASGFSSPSALAVDSVGNLYVADTGNHRVVEVPYVNGAYGANVVIATGLSGPSGFSLSGSGALYVADSGNGRVLVLSAGAGQPIGTLAATLVSGLTTPVAVAADNYGNLYIADAGTRKVLQLNLSTHVQATVLSGASTLTGVAAAPDGTVFVTDSGAKTLTKIPAPSGVLALNSAVTIPLPVTTPVGIATDQNNSLYLVDKTAKAVVEINRSAGFLNFGTVAPNTTSATLTATVTNSGNSALAFYGINLPGTPYTELASSTCPQTFPSGNAPTLAAGSTCTVAVQFAPTTSATVTQTDGFFTSDQIGGQTLVITGNLPSITGPATRVYGSASPYTLSISPDGSYTVSITGSATASATVTVTNGVGSFSLASLGVGNYTLSATDATGNVATESISVTPAQLTVASGNVSRVYGSANPAFAYTISGFANADTAATATTGAPAVTTTAVPKSPAGTYPITVAQGTLAAANYTFTTSNGTLTVTNAAAQSILFPALTNFTHGTSVAIVAMTTSGLPVTFTVTGPATISNGVLSITGTGSVSVTAAQAGNSNFGAATSVTRTFIAQ